MFEQRVKWFSILIGLLACGIGARLAEIQLVRGDRYEALSEVVLRRDTEYFRAPRGSILDRGGRVLVSDVPASDIAVHFQVLGQRRGEYLSALARKLRRSGGSYAGRTTDSIYHELLRDVDTMWETIARISGESPETLRDRAAEITRRVERIGDDVRRRNSAVRAIKEENAMHPLVEGLDGEAAIAARLELERYPWVAITPGSRRVAFDADALVHVLGRMGAASSERLDADPLGHDDLRRLRPGDLCGVSGVERTADVLLRGTRGRLLRDVDNTLLEYVEPRPGGNVQLTIDAELQKQAAEILREAVESESNAYACGGSVVVIDVATRDILVLASYPYYGYDDFASNFDVLRRDLPRDPLRFRAVANQYPPGSTCKVLTLLGALSDGVMTERTVVTCQGHLLPSNVNSFRCWIFNQYNSVHGPRDAEEAIRDSCNIYFYTAGERLGPARLCDWFRDAGLGRPQGTGLIEESAGLVPSSEWLRRQQDRDFQTADAWNFAIGQGEVTVTPLQAANVAATIASGRWEPAHLIRDADGTPIVGETEAPRQFDAGALRTIRAGMWRVVNEGGGTADKARLEVPGYEMCGKTGSAQAQPRVVTYRYTVEHVDGRRESVEALEESDVLAAFPEPKPRIVGRHAGRRFPQLEDKLPSHAWFIGYTQPTSTKRGAAPLGRVYAISVIVEYGMGGGKVAAPVAKRVAERLLGGED